MENRLGLGFVRQPKTVLFGPGQRRQLGLIAKGLGRHALMVTDERMAQTPEFKGLLANLAEQDVKTSVVDGGFDVLLGQVSQEAFELGSLGHALIRHHQGMATKTLRNQTELPTLPRAKQDRLWLPHEAEAQSVFHAHENDLLEIADGDRHILRLEEHID